MGGVTVRSLCTRVEAVLAKTGLTLLTIHRNLQYDALSNSWIVTYMCMYHISLGPRPSLHS